MTEEIQSTVDVQSSGSSNSSPAPVETSASTPTEKMLSQSEVNELVGKVKHSAYEKGRKEALGNADTNQHYQQQPSSFGGMPQLNEEQLAKIIDQRLNNYSTEVQKRAQEAEATRRVEEITTSLANKCLAVPNFEEQMKGFEWGPISPLLPSLASKDNPGEMLIELRNNPEKIANLLVLAHTMPAVAEQRLADLSNSIRMNQNAGKQPTAREPLSQITPSITGKDNGSLTVKDLRSHPKFRI